MSVYVCECACLDPWDVTDTHPYQYTLTALHVWLQYPPTVSAETPSHITIRGIGRLVSMYVCVSVCECVRVWVGGMGGDHFVHFTSKTKLPKPDKDYRLHCRNRKLRLDSGMNSLRNKFEMISFTKTTNKSGD